MGLAAVRIRARLLPGWEGAPARLVEAVIGLSILTLVLQLLGAVGLFEPVAIVAVPVAIGAAVVVPAARRPTPREGGGPARRRPSPPCSC